MKKTWRTPLSKRYREAQDGYVREMVVVGKLRIEKEVWSLHKRRAARKVR